MTPHPQKPPPPEGYPPSPEEHPASRSRLPHRLRSRVRPVAAVAATAAVTAASLTVIDVRSAFSAEPTAAAGDAYTWDNVQIVGGGYVPGIVFNESEPDLVYARTDVGGAYRWDPATETWDPLLDWVGWDEWGWTGIVSLATDPVDPDRVYAAAGSYTNDWDPGNGAILRSDDRGETWEVTELPFKLGGNMPGRGLGERMAVDPNDNSVVYLGVRGGHGLWRSTDFGETWAEVGSFPNPGDYVENPDDPLDLQSDITGVTWVAFDPRTGSAGQATQDVYVGVADLDDPVYRSTDGGRTWEPLEGAPTGHLPAHAVLDHEGGQLYLATTDTPGPYDGSSGDVWRHDIESGEWTNISPVPSTSEDAYFGYGGLTIDRQDPDTLMVTSQISWWPDNQIFRSTDRGETWTRAWDWGNYPERVTRYEMDISAAPWLDFGGPGEPPENQPKLGWMSQGMAIDPFDSDRFMYGTGATIYGSDNLTAWDSGGTVDIGVRARGLEETSIRDLAALPGGPLVSVMADIGGFVHRDLDAVPDQMHQRPYWGSGTGVDFAELAPDTVVRVGDAEDEDNSHIGISTDGGNNWFGGQEPGGVTGGGTVAVNADGSVILWSPDGAGVHRSTTTGSSWTASAGVPQGARVEADRVDPDVFYAVSDGTFYTSTDAGATFTASGFGGLPGEGNVRFGAVPGHSGDVWVAGGAEDGEYGMWRTTDAGATFERIAAVDEGDAVGFGAPAPGADYPAVYTSARIGGVRGIFRSDDAGRTWVRINDDRHQWGWTGAVVTGDPDVYGRVYIGTNGRGIVYGDLADGGGGPDPTPSPDPTPGPSPDPTPDPSPEPTFGPASCEVDYTVAGSWNGGFQAAVEVTNTGSEPVEGWELAWDFTSGESVTDLWGGDHTQEGDHVTVTAPGWSTRLDPGATAEIGFNGSVDGGPGTPTAFALNGTGCG
ncbi:cellulose binding domain-containing protein [Nocardiopsis sp. FIRDI 009]|uniref:cellulose binding domain-containing protein n=1 Tax=Nocardiopsis sp. FIRDI 009 TaxID=714197 RepID=UPI000E289181|nr:cellulose binding domain-containing protein [Nocardiopsis sp. FIRDI 009]